MSHYHSRASLYLTKVNLSNELARDRAFYAFHVDGNITKDTSDFSPIPELSRDDGDLTIVFLVGNGVRYAEETIDSWYRGMVPSPKYHYLPYQDMPPQESFSPEEAASPLGCLQQYQICNVDVRHCGPLKGYFDYQIQSASVFNISEEAIMEDGFVENNPLGQRFQWFTGVVAYEGTMALSDSLTQLGAFSLSSQAALQGGLMAALAENQWQLDVERWWATGLARMQAGFVDVAVGPSEEGLQSSTLRAPSPHIQESFCNSQVSSHHSSQAPR